MTERLNYFNYFTEIENEFVRRRGSHILISPLDWSLIETWRQRGIPLGVVLRGINASFDAYDRLPRRVRKVNSLFYCQQEVEALFQKYCESQVGSGNQVANNVETATRAETPFAPETIITYLTERGCELGQLYRAHREHSTLAETFARAARRLKGLIDAIRANNALSLEEIDVELMQIENLILEGLRASLSAEELSKLRREGDAQLQSYKQRMGQEVYEQTLNNYLARRLREQFKIPRLSLFYL